MAKPVEYGDGLFGILIKGNEKDEIRWFYTDRGREEALKKMKMVSDRKIKFSKVSRMA